MGQVRAERRLAAILAADVVGYSRLMAADEQGTHTRLKLLRKDVVEPTIAEYHGRIVKLMGDGILVEFASVVDAVECAAAIQKGIAERQGEVPVDQRVAFRMGINIGDIISEDGDIYGGGVNIATRLESLAEPGGICVSQTVYNHVQDKVEFGFEQAGEHRFKNIPEPVVVYRVVIAPGPIAKRFGLRRAGTPKGLWAALATAAVVLLAAGGIAVWVQPWRSAVEVEPTSYQTGPRELPAQPSIAVLPFENLSGDHEQTYFADGITNDIITDLSKFSTLFVIAADSSFRYRDREVKAQDVARDLGVRYLLEGSLQQADDTLRINVNLVDATTGRQVWAERYERPPENVLVVQKEIAQNIVGAIGSGGGALQRAELERIARIPTKDLRAYDFYLRGIAYKRLKTKEDNALARQMFEKAIQADPNYAVAMAECSLTYLNDIFNSWADSREDQLYAAEKLARRAIATDSSEPWGFVTLGLVYQLKVQNDQALPLLEKAHALNPNDYYVKEALGHAVTYAGSAERGVELLEQAQRLNPHRTEEHPLTLTRAYFFADRYQDAIAASNRITSRQRSPTYWLYKAATHAELGQLAEARAAVAEALKLDPDLTLQGEHERRLALGLAPAYAEHLTEALRKAGLPEKPGAAGM
jgi:TolB-like protein/class 3 adenylate cyclase